MKFPCLLVLLFCCGTLEAADAPALSVSIGVFTYNDTPDNEQAAAATGTQASSENSSPDISDASIRLAESRYIPMHLRYRLEATGRFGAVRVLPLSDNGAELMISGHIEHSDPQQLALQLRISDSTGRIWTDQRYQAQAVSSSSLYEDPLLKDDFHALYQQVIRDVLATLDSLDEQQLNSIINTALLRYGSALSPETFTAYLDQDEAGQYSIRRLPARNDPLLTRVQAIREREYLFIDVVDEEYSRFYTDIKPVYDMWREFRREQSSNAASFTERQLTEKSDFRRGSYYALQENYNNYRWAKLQETYLDELQEGFANETRPTDIELTDSIYRLTGTMEQQYREWRSILLELFRLETE